MYFFINIFSSVDFRPMDFEYEVEDYYYKLNSNESFHAHFFGVIFEKYDAKEFKYKIRIGGMSGFKTDQLFPPILPPGHSRVNGGPNSFYYVIFL